MNAQIVDNKSIQEQTSFNLLNTPNQQSQLELLEIDAIIPLINPTRANNHTSWSLMASILRQYENNGLILFNKFCKLSNKYNQAKITQKFLLYQPSEQSIDPIRTWAKEDNPVAYYNYKRANYVMHFDNKLNWHEISFVKELYTNYDKTSPNYLLPEPTFFELAMKYINHYLCIITMMPTTSYYLFEYTDDKITHFYNRKSIRAIKLICCDMEYLERDNNKIKSKSLLKYWLENSQCKKYSIYKYIEFLPDSIEVAYGDNKILYLSKGYKGIKIEHN